MSDPQRRQEADAAGVRLPVDAEYKSRVVTLRCSVAQHERLIEDAARAGLSLGAYLRRSALGVPGARSRRRPPLDREALGRLLGQVGRLGGNINQLARAFHVTGALPSRPELAEAAEELTAIRGALMEALGRRARADVRDDGATDTW